MFRIRDPHPENVGKCDYDQDEYDYDLCSLKDRVIKYSLGLSYETGIIPQVRDIWNHKRKNFMEEFAMNTSPSFTALLMVQLSRSKPVLYKLRYYPP